VEQQWDAATAATGSKRPRARKLQNRPPNKRTETDKHINVTWEQLADTGSSSGRAVLAPHNRARERVPALVPRVSGSASDRWRRRVVIAIPRGARKPPRNTRQEMPALTVNPRLVPGSPEHEATAAEP